MNIWIYVASHDNNIEGGVIVANTADEASKLAPPYSRIQGVDVHKPQKIKLFGNDMDPMIILRR